MSHSIIILEGMHGRTVAIVKISYFVFGSIDFSLQRHRLEASATILFISSLSVYFIVSMSLWNHSGSTAGVSVRVRWQFAAIWA